MRRGAAEVALAVGIAAALALGIGAAVLASYSWGQVAHYRTPYVPAPVPRATAGPASTGRVVLVIVDGLRRDVSGRMTALETLRQHGSDLTLTVPQPSLSHPDWTTILSGAPPAITGVTTNAFESRVPAETLIDVAIDSGRRTLVVGPGAMGRLYGAGRTVHYFEDYRGRYLSTRLVARTLALSASYRPQFVVLHLPDVDEAGHASGGGSAAYLKAAMRVDTDLSVLVRGLQDGRTTFVVVTDHGHTAAGGHGGWEKDVVEVPAVLAGSGAALGRGTGRQEDLAPTIAAIAGLPAPRDAVGRVLPGVLTSASPGALSAERTQRVTFLAHRLAVVTGRPWAVHTLAARTDKQLDALLARRESLRLARERDGRLPLSLLVVAAAALLLTAVGVLSPRALVAASAGTAVYYAVYDGLYFGLHGLAWSLSAIGSEERMNAFFAARLGEAALAGLVACAVAAFVYPFLRERPKGPWGPYRAGWLALGPATLLVVQATLALQVAFYLWRWGARVTWILPDLRAGFKYDLDLLQMTALGVTALVAWLVTLLAGRYHPKVAGAAPANATDTAEE